MNIEQHLGVVKKATKYFRVRKLPPSIDVEDLYQAGVVALIESAPKYDGSNGASFETYTGNRVYGAMLDEIRRGYYGPRGEKKNSNRLSIGTQYIYDLEDEDKTPPQCHDSKMLSSALSKSFDVLLDRERVAVNLYYRDNFSLAEIGQVFGFSEARACQIIGGAVKKLGTILEEWK